MTENINITPGSGEVVAADQVVDPDLGTVKEQVIKIADGVTGGTTRLHVGVNGADVNVKAIAAGMSVIGKVSVDQTTPGTTDSVTVATGQGAGATVGITSGAAVTTDASGTLQQYLRGLVKILNDVWSSGSHYLAVSIQNATLAVTQSGTWATRTQDGAGNNTTSNSTATAGKVALDNNILSILGTAPTTVGKLDVKTSDGDDATQGALADAIIAAGAAGSLSAKLRRVTQGLEDLKTTIVLAAGTALIGAVTGNKTNNNAAPGAANVGSLGVIANAAQQTWIEGNLVAESSDLKGNLRTRISDAAGNDRGANVNSSSQLSVSADNLSLNSGNTDAGTVRVVTAADGPLNTNLGATTDAAVSTDTTGSLSGKMRGLVKIFADVWDGTNHWLSVRRVKKDTWGSTTTFTCTLASLANGSARQTNLITSNTSEYAQIGVQIQTGTSPTANSVITVYLIRSDGTIADDGAGSSDAAWTQQNAPILGTIQVTATSNTTYKINFPTIPLGQLGPNFAVGILNSTGAALNASGHSVEYTLAT